MKCVLPLIHNAHIFTDTHAHTHTHAMPSVFSSCARLHSLHHLGRIGPSLRTSLDGDSEARTGDGTHRGVHQRPLPLAAAVTTGAAEASPSLHCSAVSRASHGDCRTAKESSGGNTVLWRLMKGQGGSHSPPFPDGGKRQKDDGGEVCSTALPFAPLRASSPSFLSRVHLVCEQGEEEKNEEEATKDGWDVAAAEQCDRTRSYA